MRKPDWKIAVIGGSIAALGLGGFAAAQQPSSSDSTVPEGIRLQRDASVSVHSLSSVVDVTTTTIRGADASIDSLQSAASVASLQTAASVASVQSAASVASLDSVPEVTPAPQPAPAATPAPAPDASIDSPDTSVASVASVASVDSVDSSL